MLWPSKLPEAQRPNGAVEVMDATDVFSLVAMDIYIYNIYTWRYERLLVITIMMTVTEILIIIAIRMIMIMIAIMYYKSQKHILKLSQPMALESLSYMPMKVTSTSSQPH